MTHHEAIDPRLSSRPNTRFLSTSRHGTALKYIASCISGRPNIYFYPVASPVTEVFLWARRHFRLRTKLAVHVVSTYGLMKDRRNNWFGGESVVRAIRVADFVATNGSAVSEDVGREFNRVAPTIYDAVDPDCFFPCAPGNRCSGRRIRALFVGSLRPYKRPRHVVELAARFPEVMFTLIGDGEERVACERLATHLAAHNVVFMGNQPPATVGEEMQQVRCFRVPLSRGGTSASSLPGSRLRIDCHRARYLSPGFSDSREDRIPSLEHGRDGRVL